jgi:hypothetical protein
MMLAKCEYAVLLLVLTLAVPSVSEACKCRRASQPVDVAVTQALISADVAFLGNVIASIERGPKGAGSITFEAKKWWKGPVVKPDSLRFRLQGTFCDIWAEPGEEIIIYGFGPDEDGNYNTTTCDLMTGARDIEEETRILDSLDLSDLAEWNRDYFAYGCGGGIAATYPISVIYRDGRMSQSSNSHRLDVDRRPRLLPSNPAFADEIFETLENIDLAAINNIREPAPRSCYFRALIGPVSYSADWGGGGTKMPVELEELGRRLVQRANDANTD